MAAGFPWLIRHDRAAQLVCSTATAALPLLPRMPRVCDTDRWCWRATVVGRLAVGQTLLGQADCAARRTGCCARLGTA
ncbi:hypothetical protein NDU88_004195 [Pleurodeles waltl]|uniref:Uncharacterized protein n=1 Tax=Pleurodeles waltl TaxID=8319 RepID=A0AAV7RJL9_PLEWA|nr:hypothetical protein NDU88_004195 [Pleurodeles waltl]